MLTGNCLPLTDSMTAESLVDPIELLKNSYNAFASIVAEATINRSSGLF